MAKLPYKRILLKVSGEVLAGDQQFGIEPKFLTAMAEQIVAASKAGAEIAIVIGAGNIFRGMAVAAEGTDRVTADLMGMLGTVINSLALSNAITRGGVKAKVFSALTMPSVADSFTARAAKAALDDGFVVVCAGGTGNPFFTTDTAASLRAIEIGAELLLKGTKVNGIYSDDPVKNPAAVHYPKLNFDRVLDERLNVMDATAIVMCRDNNLPLRVFNLNNPGDLLRIARGEDVGTVVTNN